MAPVVLCSFFFLAFQAHLIEFTLYVSLGERRKYFILYARLRSRQASNSPILFFCLFFRSLSFFVVIF